MVFFKGGNPLFSTILQKGQAFAKEVAWYLRD